MSHRKGKGTTRATRPAVTPEPAIYYKTPVTPEEAFQAIGRLRKEARDEIDRLIRFLDKTDDYVSRELEDSIDDNPHDEETDDNGEDNEDADPAEPSLGSVGTCISIKSGGRTEAAATSSKTTPNPALEIKTDWTNKCRSAIGKTWGWCDEN